MAYKPTLSDEQARILATRVEIARSVGIISLRQITNGWGIHITTLYRYQNPQYREYSRVYDHKKYVERRKNLVQGICHSCEEELEGHPRCGDCTILMHSGSPLCDSCVDARAWRTMKGYQSPIAYA